MKISLITWNQGMSGNKLESRVSHDFQKVIKLKVSVNVYYLASHKSDSLISNWIRESSYRKNFSVSSLVDNFNWRKNYVSVSERKIRTLLVCLRDTKSFAILKKYNSIMCLIDEKYLWCIYSLKLFKSIIIFKDSMVL